MKTGNGVVLRKLCHKYVSVWADSSEDANTKISCLLASACVRCVPQQGQPLVLQTSGRAASDVISDAVDLMHMVEFCKATMVDGLDGIDGIEWDGVMSRECRHSAGLFGCKMVPSISTVVNTESSATLSVYCSSYPSKAVQGQGTLLRYLVTGFTE